MPNNITSALTDNELFKDVQQSQLQNIISKETAAFREGDIIFKTGDPAENIYLILDGEVKLKIQGGLSSPIIVKKKRNQHFGEKEILENIPRKSSAVAETNCTFFILKKSDVLKLLDISNEFKQNMAGGLKSNPSIRRKDIIFTENTDPIGDIPFFKVDKLNISEPDTSLDSAPPAETILPPSDFTPPAPEYIPPAQPEILNPPLPGQDFNSNNYNTGYDSNFSTDNKFSLGNDENSAGNIEPDPFDYTKGFSSEDDPFDYSKFMPPGENPDTPASPDNYSFPDIVTPPSDIPDIILPPGNDFKFPDNEDLSADNFSSENFWGANTEPEAPAEDINFFDKPYNEETPIPATEKPDIFSVPQPEDDFVFRFNEPAPPPDIDFSDIPPFIPKRTEEDNNISSYDDNSFTPDEPFPLQQISTPSEIEEFHDSSARGIDDTYLDILVAIEKIGSSIQYEDLFTNIPTSVSELLHSTSNTLYIVNTEENSLTTYDPEALDIKERKSELNTSKFASSCASREIIYGDNSLIIPVENKNGNVIAVLELKNSASGSFGSKDEHIIKAFTPFIADVIENALLSRKEKSNARLESLKSMSQLLLNDIKRPLLMIRHYVEYLKQKDADQESFKVLELIAEQSGSVLELAQTVKEFSEDSIKLNLVECEVTLVLDEYLTLLAEYTESRKVKVLRKYEGQGTALIDRRKLYQVVYQLVKNSCDSMPQGGRIFFVIKREDPNLIIEIKDEGLGIPEHVLPEIMQPFYSYGKKDAAGLGLNIASDIISKHKGTLSCKSVYTEGAVFTITLPAADIY